MRASCKNNKVSQEKKDWVPITYFFRELTFLHISFIAELFHIDIFLPSENALLKKMCEKCAACTSPYLTEGA